MVSPVMGNAANFNEELPQLITTMHPLLGSLFMVSGWCQLFACALFRLFDEFAAPGDDGRVGGNRLELGDDQRECP